MKPYIILFICISYSIVCGQDTLSQLAIDYFTKYDNEIMDSFGKKHNSADLIKEHVKYKEQLESPFNLVKFYSFIYNGTGVDLKIIIFKFNAHCEVVNKGVLNDTILVNDKLTELMNKLIKKERINENKFISIANFIIRIAQDSTELLSNNDSLHISEKIDPPQKIDLSPKFEVISTGYSYEIYCRDCISANVFRVKLIYDGNKLYIKQKFLMKAGSPLILI
jgi:hypothetical protein